MPYCTVDKNCAAYRNEHPALILDRMRRSCDISAGFKSVRKKKLLLSLSLHLDPPDGDDALSVCGGNDRASEKELSLQQIRKLILQLVEQRFLSFMRKDVFIDQVKMKCAIQIAKLAEEKLFKSARSLNEYKDTSTLNARVKAISMKMREVIIASKMKREKGTKAEESRKQR